MLIKNGILFTHSERRKLDLRITDDRIDTIAPNLSPLTGEEVIDATGLFVLPGAIDEHVHFRDPGAPHKEDFATGSAAAVSGGVTTVLDMPNTNPTTTDAAALADKKQTALAKSHVNFGLYFGATPYNLSDATKLYDQTAGLKIFMGCSTGDLLVYKLDDLEPIFAGYDRLIAVHAEMETRLHERTERHRGECDASIHSKIRDPEAARQAVELACELAQKFRRRLHILHMSTRVELDTIRRYRDAGVSITCEVCPHHLFMDTSWYAKKGTLVKVNPPIRDPYDVKAMWEGLHDGSIQCIASDHAPHTLEEKMRDYWHAPSGMPGVETILPVMLDAACRNICSYEQVVDWLCHNPAKIFGIRERGELREGYYADVVIVDPGLKREVRGDEMFTKCGWTPLEGEHLTGWPVKTFVNGALAFERGVGRGSVIGVAGGRDIYS